mmetsp:Transcript_57518/g.135342  ORF Transcript_57518/g.135342 Transcript_57518/m.135342 type:complete len:416 (-) Transcript_57518:75-1322(-)
MGDVWNRLKNFDAYPKTKEDFRIKTLPGATVSIISTVFIVVLMFSEFSMYLQHETFHELLVDTSRGEMLQINLNVTFPRMPCSVISLDTMDISGEQQLDVAHSIFKQRIDAEGNPVGEKQKEEEIKSDKNATKVILERVHKKKGEKDADGEKGAEEPEKVEEEKPAEKAEAGVKKCGSCYGAEDHPGQCCNTCDEVREAYRKRGWAFSLAQHITQCQKEGFLQKLQQEKHEGCNIHGHLEVNKVAGNFHFAPGKSFQQAHMHVHDLMPFHTSHYNVSHKVEGLSFGEDFPDRVNPLDHVDRKTNASSAMFQYFIKVVPTTYQYLDGTVLKTNQFSVTEHFRSLESGGMRGLPGVFFFYDLSPIMVRFTEQRKSFLHFLVQLCAIVGGVFTVAGILDGLIYNSQKMIKKIQMGKQS